MKHRLTLRQRQILNYLREHALKHHTWPSVREIQKKFGFASTNAVAGHLRALELKGVLQRVPGQARTFRLTKDAAAAVIEGGAETVELPPDAIPLTSLPIFGTIAAGYPDGVEQGDALGRLQVPVEMAPRRGVRAFALRVRGDSMIDAGLHDGDTVVIEPRSPRNGDIVAALLDGQSTLKRYVVRPGSAPYLKAENKLYPSLFPADELVIQGVATAVVRKLN